MSRPLTPAEFEKQMQLLVDKSGSDTEGFHVDADNLMTKTLYNLGYTKGIKIYRSQDKWYA